MLGLYLETPTLTDHNFSGSFYLFEKHIAPVVYWALQTTMLHRYCRLYLSVVPLNLQRREEK